MKRIFNKTTKEEYFIGQPISVSYKDDSGNSVNVVANHLTPELVKWLFEAGVVAISDAHPKNDNPSISKDINDYIVKVGKKCGLDRDGSMHLFGALYKVSPVSAFSLVLKQIALELDKKYADHIRDSKQIFSVSTTNGTIIEIPVKTIRSFRNFAAFRTLEDAKFACRVCRELLKDMFSDAK